ncbi:MAG: RHS repeat domain-containing protein [Cyclobacteriaceae bacterium]
MQHKHIRRIIYPGRKLFRDKLKLLFISGVVALSIHNSFAQPVREQGYIVSPSALAMVKAGQVPVNLSAGLLDYSIPLFEINSDDFKWPVTLGYSYSGLKLEEAPGEVGLGWSIAGLGGVVTREVRGLPDEHVRGYFGAESRSQYVKNFQSPADLPTTVIQDFASGLYDAEPDKFIVSAGEVVFSFFITSTNCNTCPLSSQQISVTANTEQAKVVFGWDQIEITDAGGHKYIFNEKETTSFYSPYQYNQEKMQDYTGAWHLTSIQMPSGRQINFTYGKKTLRDIRHGETFDRTLNPYGERVMVDCATLGGNNNSGYNQEVFVRDINHLQQWSSTDVQAPFLNSIQWPGGNRLTVTRQDIQGFIPLATGIEVRNMNERIVKQIAFTYDLQARPLLSRLLIGRDEQYDFDYYPVSTPVITQPAEGKLIDPAQNPYAQDYWGFYNGRSNPSAIPELGGDRRSDFLSTLQGALKSISWPTGGVTEIFYEQNQIRMSAADFQEQEPESANRNYNFSFNAEPYTTTSASKTFVFDQVTYALVSHQAFIKGTSAQLNASFGPLTGCSGINCRTYYTYSDEMRSLYPDQAPKLYPVFGAALTGDVVMQGCGDFGACVRESVSRWIRIEPGTYLLEVNAGSAEAASFQLNIDFFDPDPDNLKPMFYNVPAGGIRVAATKDCPDPGRPAGCMQKRYSYNDEAGFSSGSYLSKLDKEFTYQVYDAIDCRERSGPGDGGQNSLPLYYEWNYPAVRKSFKSLNPLTFHSGSPVYYSRVTVRDDDSANAGSEIKYFRPTTWALSGSYPFVPLPQDHIHGIVWKTELKNEAGVKVKEVTSDHIVTGIQGAVAPPPGLVTGISKSYRYAPLLFPDTQESFQRSMFLFTKYTPEFSTTRLLRSEIEKEEPGIGRSVFYKYNNRLQVSSDSTVNSNGNISVNRYEYPYNLSDPGYDLLTSQNRISKPVKVSGWINGIQREFRQTHYKNWATQGLIAEPLKTEIWRDGVRFPETEFTEYTATGRPVSQTSREGIISTLIWNTDQTQVISEVFGARSAEVFYTSFEKGEGQGNSLTGDSHCGTLSKTGGFTRSMTGLNPATTYRLTWFEKSGGLWLLKFREVKPDQSGSFLISLTGQVDDVRFHPVQAQMTSYTLEPLTGITSVTDPNNISTYYEYDLTGRLITISDSEKNLLKKHQYQYGKKP